METERTSPPPAARQAAGVAARVRRAWRALAPEQRLAAAAALALLGSMFLPWYEKNAVPSKGARGFVSDSVSAFGAVSFVEAAVFLVAVGVMALLFARAERRPFHLPGGDGAVITGAGLWAAVLIFYRVFDRPDVTGTAATVGIQWGFFVAFLAAGALAWAGNRVRAAHRPEPPIVDRGNGRPAETSPPARRPQRATPPPREPGEGQLSFEELPEAADPPPAPDLRGRSGPPA